MKNIFCLLVIFTINSFASTNLIKDAKMRDFENQWLFWKNPEFNYVEPKIKKSEFRAKTKHASSGPYMGLLTNVDLELGKNYQLSYEIKLRGEGRITFRAQVLHDLINRKKTVSKLDEQIIHLAKIYSANNEEWNKVVAHFKVEQGLPHDHVNSILFRMGEFKGDIYIKNIELIEVDKECTKKFGTMKVELLK